MDNGLVTGAIFIDFRKAFDTIDHVKLLDKLKLFGIRNEGYNCMNDYLSSRQQSVSLGGVLSDPQPVLTGVPQGSILGPLLFSLYVTDLPDSIQIANILMYADDTVLFYGASSYAELIPVLNSELSHLASWSSINELFIHPRKTEYVIFGTSQKLHKSGPVADNGDVLLGDQVLKQKPFYKYLGVYLDETLTFKEHTTKLFNKVSSQLGLFARIRNNLTIQAAEMVFRSMVLPKLEYCDFVWNNLSSSMLERLERLQIRAARIILKEQDLSHEQLLQQLGWKTLNSRCNIHRLVFVFKCLHSKGPEFFNDYFNISSHPYATRRNGIDVILPKIRTEIAKKGCFYLGAKQFNDLPSEVKLASSLLIFKSKLGEFNFT